MRRSTKSIVLGKAKVMSYEDLAAARKKRMEKEASDSANKKTRGRKRKGRVQVTNVQGTETGTARPDEMLVLGNVPTQVIRKVPARALETRSTERRAFLHSDHTRGSVFWLMQYIADQVGNRITLHLEYST